MVCEGDKQVKGVILQQECRWGDHLHFSGYWAHRS